MITYWPNCFKIKMIVIADISIIRLLDIFFFLSHPVIVEKLK